MRVEVDMSELEQELAHLAARGENCEPQMQVLAADLVREVNQQFDSSGRGRFPALAPSTLRRKAKAGKSSQPLLYNGGWRNSHAPEYGANFAETTTDRSYALFHVSDQPRFKIPLRDPYAFDQAFWDDAVERIITFVTTGDPT